tara:strand:+ start:221 stop:331 length:111 start_codon:yes stop_codon:yes gene_type:complete
MLAMSPRALTEQAVREHVREKRTTNRLKSMMGGKGV